MIDQNKPNQFGSKVAIALNNGDPNAAAVYSAQPQIINSVIAATEQQLQQNNNPRIDMDGQFIKNYIWTALKPPQNIQQPKMKPTPQANPLQGA